MKINDLYGLFNGLVNKQTAANGILMIKGTAAQTPSAGTYYAVQFVTDCTPTTFTASNSTLIEDFIYPAGTIIYADVTAITCGSNEVYALYKV